MGLTYSTWGAKCRCHSGEEQLAFFTYERNARSYQQMKLKSHNQEKV